MAKPEISVIIPVYNRYEVLKPVVESILAQTLPVMEIIIVDDGSFDETPQALPKYIAETPSWAERVKYFRQENQGQSAANNLGIARAKGEWLAFSANDDPWLPQKLEWQFRALEKYPDCQVCFTDAWFMNNPCMKMTAFQLAGRAHTEMLGIISDPLSYILKANPRHGVTAIWVQTVVARADLVRRLGGLDAKLRYSEDHDFVFRLACATKFCFVGAPMVLIDRRPAADRHVGQSKNWHKLEFVHAMQEYRFEKMLRLGEGVSREVRKVARRGLSNVYSGRATCQLEKGAYAEAKESIRRAAQFWLTPTLAAKLALIWIAPALARRAVSAREKARAQAVRGVGQAYQA